MGQGSTVASLSVNLPSDAGTLTAEEAATAFLVSQGFYDFRLPSLGQGFNVAPGLTWAFPLSDRLALGVGVAYQYRGAFQPRREVADGYDPGDEVLLTGGLDYRLGEASAFALDLTYAAYGADAWGAASYRTGNAATVTAQLNTTVRRHDVRLLGRFRAKAASSLPAEATAFGADAAIPTHGRALAHVRLALGPRFYLGVLAQGRTYAASDVFGAKALVDGRLMPELKLSSGVTLHGRVSATVGDLNGFEVGGGLTWEL